MLNHIDLAGHLVADPEIRKTPSDVKTASFRVAVSRDFGGENRETDFINVIAWRQTAEFVEKYFKKGSLIIVSGRLQMRTYTDKEGARRTAAEVVADSVYFGDSKLGVSANPPAKSHPKPAVQPAKKPNQPAGEELDPDVDLPF